jgi:hypothetical protein
MSWSVRDTTAWLCSQGLQQYQDRFAKNEISGMYIHTHILMKIYRCMYRYTHRYIHTALSPRAPFMWLLYAGPILMEIGLDDLDYMGITVLAHRKVIPLSILTSRGSAIMKPD